MKSPAITRRSFVERLGFSAGSALLAPIASTLLLEAKGHAQVSQRKRAVFFLIGDCLHFEPFTPAEFRGNMSAPVLPGSTTFTMPAAFKSLEPHRSRLLLIDGLALRLKRSQHSGGYGSLSGFTSPNDASNEYAGPPGGITIDQFVAGKLSASTKLKSLLFGQHKYDASTMTFASGANRAESHFTDPALMWQRVFEGVSTSTNPADQQALLAKGNMRRKMLLDSVRTDITRLQGSLAAEERRKLDHYVAAMEEFDKRAALVMPIACTVPPKPGVSDPKQMDYRRARLDVLYEMGVLALVCGVTNVMGVAAATGMSHKMNIFPNIGHSYPEAIPAATETYNLMAGKLARLVTALQGIREGDRTAWDNATMVFTSDNGETHHSSKRRWPIAILGNAGGRLRADGRFLRFPPTGTPRALVDLYATIAVALGVPGGESFGKGGVEMAQGPIDDLLA